MPGPDVRPEPRAGAMPAQGTGRGTTPRIQRVLLVLLCAWSLSLRLWFAWPGSNQSRFWDERYSIRNIHAFLDHPSLRPANGFYPTLSWLPHAIVLYASETAFKRTGDVRFQVRDQAGMRPLAYHVCRGMQSLFATACLALVYVIGAHIESETVGLLAAFFLATNPYHVRMSGEYKPDGLLWFLLLGAFYLTLAAIERPRLRSYLLAGAAIGASVSAKYNAAPIAVPIAVLTLLRVRPPARAAALLVVAGAAAIGVVLLLQPYAVLDPGLYQRDFGVTLRHYAWHGEVNTGGSHLAMLAHFFRVEPEAEMFGALVGGIGLLGLALVAYRSVRSLADRSRAHVGWLLSTVTVVSYVLAYSFATTNPTHHNWMLVAPHVALAAAYLSVMACSWLRRRVPALSRPLLQLALGLVLVVALSWRVNAYVYESAVPTTEELALLWLKHGLGSPSGRVVYSEIDLALGGRRSKPPRRPGLVVAPRLDAVETGALDLADAEVFRGARLEDAGTSRFYRARMTRDDGVETQVMSPRAFRARGEALVVVLHPFPPASDPEEATWVCEPTATTPDPPPAGLPGRCQADARRPIGAGEILTVAFLAPHREPPAEIVVGGGSPGSIDYDPVTPDLELRLTPRFRVAPGPLRLELHAGLPADWALARPLTIWRWRDRPAGDAAAASGGGEPEDEDAHAGGEGEQVDPR